MAESVSKPHTLIIREVDGKNPLTDEPWREWEIIHPDDCPKDDEIDYDCMVQHEVVHNGLDSLWPEWTTLATGEHEIEVWAAYDPYSMEYDGGMRLLEEED